MFSIQKEKPMSQREKGITFSLLSIALISMVIILILALMKVYLSNQIYHESRKVNIIEAEVLALKEENNILQMNVEQLKYKSRIEDTIFNIDEDEKEETDKTIRTPVVPVNTRALWEGTGND
jgi:cell division protein FtsL